MRMSHFYLDTGNAQIPVLSTLGRWHFFLGLFPDGPRIPPAGMTIKKDQTSMTKKRIKVLTRTGAEARSIYRFIEAGRNRIWVVWSGRDRVIFGEGVL